MPRSKPWPHRSPLVLALVVGAGCPADSTPESTTSGSSTGQCADVAPAADGSTIDLGGWSPPLDIDSQGEWDGSCTIADVGPEATSLDCTDPQGPTSIGLSFALAGADAPWQPGQVVDVSYHADGWNDGEYLSLRASEDGGLLLALGYGGGDGGFAQLGDFIAPLTFDDDLEACGVAGSGEVLPAEITFYEPDGDGFAMMQGDAATLEGAAGEQYSVVLFRAEDGDLMSDHYGSFIDVVVQRLP